MGDVLTFVPRPLPVAPEALDALPALSRADQRARLEEVLQNTLDVTDHILAILDAWDGDADLEPDADAEPSLAAPENPGGSQLVWMRGGDEDREAEVPETVLPAIRPGDVLPWKGAGNVVSAAGVAILALVMGGT